MAERRMMTVFKDKSFDSTSGTDTIKINRNYEIDELLFLVKAENGATRNAVASGQQQTIEEAITKLELLSGGKTFRKYSGEICRRMDAYESGRHPWEVRTQEGGAYQEALFRMPFTLDNHELGPPENEIIFPAPLLGSLDLVVDYDFTQSATTGFATGLTYDMYIYGRTPSADMHSKLVRTQVQKGSFTTVAGGEKAFDLTIDRNRRLRRVFVQCYEIVEPEGAHISDVQLTVNSVEKYKQRWKHIQAMNAADRHLNWVQSILIQAGGNDVFVTRVPNPRPQYSAIVAAGANYISARDDDSLTLAATATDVSYLQVGSDVIPTVAVLDFDRDGNLANLIPQGGAPEDPDAVTSIELILNDILADGSVKYYEESLVRGWL